MSKANKSSEREKNPIQNRKSCDESISNEIKLQKVVYQLFYLFNLVHLSDGETLYVLYNAPNHIWYYSQFYSQNLCRTDSHFSHKLKETWFFSFFLRFFLHVFIEYHYYTKKRSAWHRSKYITYVHVRCMYIV